MQFFHLVFDCSCQMLLNDVEGHLVKLPYLRDVSLTQKFHWSQYNQLPWTLFGLLCHWFNRPVTFFRGQALFSLVPSAPNSNYILLGGNQLVRHWPYLSRSCTEELLHCIHKAYCQQQHVASSCHITVPARQQMCNSGSWHSKAATQSYIHKRITV